MSKVPRVLIAEDEPKIAALLVEYLRDAGYDAVTESHGDRVAAAIDTCRPDLLLLDVMLSGMDGMQTLREVRRRSALPVIMLTARDEEIDRLLGLESRAVDYICKPFSPREVVARTRLVATRRRQPAAEPVHRRRGATAYPVQWQAVVADDHRVSFVAMHSYEVWRMRQTLKEFLQSLAQQDSCPRRR